MKYWQRTTFWTKVKDSVQGVLAITQLSLVIGDAQHIYNILTFLGQIIGLLIPIWMEDTDKNGEVDLFQKTVTIKSETPIEIETKTENKPTQL